MSSGNFITSGGQLRSVAMERNALHLLKSMKAADANTCSRIDAQHCSTTLNMFAEQTYRRHCAFAVATHYEAFDNAPRTNERWTSSRVLKAPVRSGHILLKAFVHAQVEALRVKSAPSTLSTSTSHVAWVNDLGNAMVQSAEFKHRNVSLQKHDSISLRILAAERNDSADAEMRADFESPLLGAQKRISDRARVFAAMRRNVFTDLHFFSGSVSDGMPLMCTNGSAVVEVEVRLRPWVDLVRCLDATSPAYVSDTVIDADIEGGTLNAINLVYVSVYLDTTALSVASQALVRTPRRYQFIKAVMDERPVVANDSGTGQLAFDLHAPVSRYSIVYRRNGAIGSGTPKSYFDFSSVVPDAALPVPLRAATLPNTYWPCDPIEYAAIAYDNVVAGYGSGEQLRLLSNYVAQSGSSRPRQGATDHYVYTVPVSMARCDDGQFVDSDRFGEHGVHCVTNKTVEIGWRSTNAAQNGVAASGLWFVYAHCQNEYVLDEVNNLMSVWASY